MFQESKSHHVNMFWCFLGIPRLIVVHCLHFYIWYTCFWIFVEMFRITYFAEHLQVAAPVCLYFQEIFTGYLIALGIYLLDVILKWLSYCEISCYCINWLNQLVYAVLNFTNFESMCSETSFVDGSSRIKTIELICKN